MSKKSCPFPQFHCVGNSVLNEISSKTAQFVKIAETLIQYKADVNR